MASKDVEKNSNVSEQEEALLDEKQLMIIDKALAVQAPLARKYVDGLRRKHLEWSDDEVVEQLEKRFKRLAIASGVGIGGAAALPAIGTVTALALTVGEGAAFAEACAFLTLGTAYVRGVDMSDSSVRRTVILAILGGERGAQIVTKALGKSGLQWAAVLDGVAPKGMTDLVNGQVQRWVRRLIARRLTGVWAGRLIPFGIGAAIGGVGNRMLASSVIDASREIFSHVGESYPSMIEGDSPAHDTTK